MKGRVTMEKMEKEEILQKTRFEKDDELITYVNNKTGKDII